MISYDKGVQIDDTLLHAHLYDYSRVLGKDIGQVIKHQAALFCQDMIKYTAPYAGQSPGGGETGTAKKHGQDSVKSSIMHLFRTIKTATPSQIASIGRPDVFKLWVKMIDDGKADTYTTTHRRSMKWSTFQTKFSKSSTPLKFISKGGISEMKAFHNQNRKDNGRGGLNKSAKAGLAFVEDEADLKEYIKLKQANVGMLKSPYYHSAQAIGEFKVSFPKWTQHLQSRNDAIAVNDVNKPQMPEVTVGNKIGGKLARTEKYALNRRGDAMRNAIVRQLDKDKMPLWEAVAHGRITGTLPYYDNGNH